VRIPRPNRERLPGSPGSADAAASAPLQVRASPSDFRLLRLVIGLGKAPRYLILHITQTIFADKEGWRTKSATLECALGIRD
jgi:hypothetical protein